MQSPFHQDLRGAISILQKYDYRVHVVLELHLHYASILLVTGWHVILEEDNVDMPDKIVIYKILD